MADWRNAGSIDDMLDALEAQIAAETPNKHRDDWSIAEINRLLSEDKGEDDMPFEDYSEKQALYENYIEDRTPVEELQVPQYLKDTYKLDEDPKPVTVSEEFYSAENEADAAEEDLLNEASLGWFGKATAAAYAAEAKEEEAADAPAAETPAEEVPAEDFEEDFNAVSEEPEAPEEPEETPSSSSYFQAAARKAADRNAAPEEPKEATLAEEMKAVPREEKTRVIHLPSLEKDPESPTEQEYAPNYVDNEPVPEKGMYLSGEEDPAEEGTWETDLSKEDAKKDRAAERKANAEKMKNRFKEGFRSFRSGVQDFLNVKDADEYEDYEDEYDEPAYAPADPEEVPVEHNDGQEVFFDRDSDKTRVMNHPSSQIIEDHNVRVKGELKKGLDENPESPKMIMELADDSRPVDKNEKRALAGKTVGIHPIFNENIQHQIVTDRVERTGTMHTDKYRERFLNKPQQKLENTAEYEALHKDEKPEAIERPGMLIRKSNFTNTADLEPIPTIIAADAELNNFDKTIVAQGDAPTVKHEGADEIDGQIKLLGFDEEEEPLPQIDEDNAEELLRERREQKIQEFKIDPSHFDHDPSDAPLTEVTVEDDDREYEDVTSKRVPRISKDAITSDFMEDEYRRTSDRSRIEQGFQKSKKGSLVTTVVQGAITVIALIFGIICSAIGNGLESLFGDAVIMTAINLGLLLVAAMLGTRTLTKGVRGFINLKINAAGAITIVVFAALLQEIVVFITARSTAPECGLYTTAACFALTLSSLNRYLSLRRAGDNFAFLTGGTALYSTESIPSEEDAFEIGRNLMIGDPGICYNARIRNPRKFVENSFADDPADYDQQLPTLIILGLSLILGIVFGAVEHSFIIGLTMFTAVICISVPAFATLASNIGLFVVDQEFCRTGSVIVGHRAVEESAEFNAIAIDSTDIFPSGSANIVGIKPFRNMRIDDAILYSAALVIESEGPLSEVFENTILAKNDLLPPVESLAYEERLGLSAWIHNRRVLFGNRDLLINHNVEPMDQALENQYLHDGRKVMYLAIAGKAAAMFVIEYKPEPALKETLQNADRAGLTLLVRNTDCNINEELICKFYDLPLSAVKVLSPVSGDILQYYRKMEKKSTPAGILHNGTVSAALKSVYEARRLYDGIYTNTILSYGYSIVAAILSIVMAAVSAAGVAGLTDYKVFLCQLIFGAIAVAVPALRSRVK